jgi:DNA-directed RNA polymerase subunit RPC12/RpoP
LESVEYKCPNCSADLKFNPTTQKLDCEYCLSSFTVEEVKNVCANTENSIPEEAVQMKEDFENHTHLYRCQSCGAEIIADDQQTATFCYYCHNPVILAGKMGGEYKPDKVIGFKIDKDLAVKNFKQWVAKRWFVPKDFKSQQQLEKLTGLYVPFWIADCNVNADFRAVGKKVRHWTSGNYQYTETKEYRIIRQCNMTTSGIPADGETKIDDLLMEAIEPYDYKDLKDFSMSYLSGFYADKYDVDKAQVFPRIRARSNLACSNYIKGTISGYTSVSPSVEQYNIVNTNWNYTMLPVWFMAYKYKDKVYEFAMNGQTGKLAGTPPLSKGKLALASLALGAAVTLVCGLIGGVIL